MLISAHNKVNDLYRVVISVVLIILHCLTVNEHLAKGLITVYAHPSHHAAED